MHTPPATYTDCAPAAPLLPIPLIEIQIARSRCSAASDRKKSSTGRWCPRFSNGSVRCRRPSRIVTVRPGAITYT